MDIEVELSRATTSQELEKLNLFREKGEILIDNWESLIGSAIKLSGFVGVDEEGKMNSTGLGIDIYRLKALYVDFRHFILQKDQVQFYKIRNLIASLVEDGRAMKCLVEIKKHWGRSDKAEVYCSYKIEEIIDVTFNAEVFHVRDQNQLKKLEIIRESMSDSFRNRLVVTAIMDKINAIRNLCWVIEPLTAEKHVIRIPSWFA